MSTKRAREVVTAANRLTVRFYADMWYGIVWVRVYVGLTILSRRLLMMIRKAVL